MLNDENLLSFVLEKCKEHGITGYDIGKNTDVAEQTAYKILDGSSKKPRRKNLLKILHYLEEKVLGSKIPSVTDQKTYNDIESALLQVNEEVDAIYRKVSISDIFTDIGTELLLSYKKQISIHELNTELFKKNSHLMEEKIEYLTRTA